MMRRALCRAFDLACAAVVIQVCIAWALGFESLQELWRL